MSQGRKCADTVPSNIGTLGLDEWRVAVLFNPLLVFIVIWVSPPFPFPFSCVGRSLRSRALRIPRVGSVGVAWLTWDEKQYSEWNFGGAPDGVIGVLIVDARGCPNVHTGV